MIQPRDRRRLVVRPARRERRDLQQIDDGVLETEGGRVLVFVNHGQIEDFLVEGFRALRVLDEQGDGSDALSPGTNFLTSSRIRDTGRRDARTSILTAARSCADFSTSQCESAETTRKPLDFVRAKGLEPPPPKGPGPKPGACANSATPA